MSYTFYIVTYFCSTHIIISQIILSTICFVTQYYALDNTLIVKYLYGLIKLLKSNNFTNYLYIMRIRTTVIKRNKLYYMKYITFY